MPRMAANRPKNFTRFSRTMAGGEERSLAPVMGCDSVMSTSAGLLALCTRLRSGQRRLLGVPFSSRSGAGLPLLGSILGGALGLNVGGAENAVASKFSFSQGLRVVLESVGRSFSSAVNHLQRAVLFHQQELQMCALALDGAGNNISCDAQPLAVCAVAHAVQFLDGDVVALAVLHAGVGKIAQRKQDHGDHRAKAHIPASLIRHRMKPLQLPQTFPQHQKGAPNT